MISRLWRFQKSTRSLVIVRSNLKSQTQVVTDLPESPTDERRSRMIRYSIAMSIRMVCIVLAMVLQGWMMWVCFAGAILLPYFAVIIANAKGVQAPVQKATRVVAAPLQITAEDFRIQDEKK